MTNDVFHFKIKGLCHKRKTNHEKEVRLVITVQRSIVELLTVASVFILHSGLYDAAVLKGKHLF